jgi:hypothetical protein
MEVLFALGHGAYCSAASCETVLPRRGFLLVKFPFRFASFRNK